MAFKDCIASAKSQGVLSQEEADDLIRRYEAHVGANAKTADPRGAEGAAKDALAAELSDEAARKKALAGLSAAKTKDLAEFAAAYRGPDGKADVRAAFEGVLENRNDALIGRPSVVGRRDALLGQAHGMMGKFLFESRRRFSTGLRGNRARIGNVVDEAFGANTGDVAAREWLSAWRRSADWLVDRFNAAGGAIGKLENYFPQSHDARKILSAGRDAWKSFIAPRLDIDRMRDPLSGAALTAARLDEALDVIWRRIVTDGASDLKPSGQARGRGALANQRQDERFLQFKDAASWRDYAEAFGEADPYAAMMNHIAGLAKDTAALEILGPNPNATVEWMKQVLQSEAAKANLGEQSLYRKTTKIGKVADMTSVGDPLGSLWTLVNGSVGVGNLTAAELMGAARNVVTAANLPGAALTAFLTDPLQQRTARHFAGVSQLRFLADAPRQILSGASKRSIAQAGLVFEDALTHLTTQYRGIGFAATAREATAFLPDRVLTWTGLTPWTRANRRAQAMSFMFEAGNSSAKSLDQLAASRQGERFARWLEGFGIDAAGWDAIRASAGRDYGEAGRMIRPVDIADPELSLRYSEAVHAFIEEAVPEGTNKARRQLGRTAKPGTFVGELTRGATSYVTYPATMMLSLARATALEAAAGGGGLPSIGRGGGFFAAAFLGLTIGGAMTLQLRALRQGRDPENMKSGAFWARALGAGGAMSWYGDYLLADYQRGSADQLARVAGPVFGAGFGLLAATGGQASLSTDSDINVKARLVNWARKNVPVQNMWWIKPAVDRLIWDRLQLIADPKASRNWQRKANQILRDQGQGTWWPAGQIAPTRAPDFGAIGGG